MRYPKEFWLLFLLLDRCYTHCREDDLGGLLGALNPQIWADGLPADRADLADWEDTHHDDDLRRDAFIKRVIAFLQDFCCRYGFDFPGPLSAWKIWTMRNTPSRWLLPKERLRRGVPPIRVGNKPPVPTDKSLKLCKAIITRRYISSSYR